VLFFIIHISKKRDREKKRKKKSTLIVEKNNNNKTKNVQGRKMTMKEKKQTKNQIDIIHTVLLV